MVFNFLMYYKIIVVQFSLILHKFIAGSLSGNQLNMMHMQQRKPGECMTNMMSGNAASFQAGTTRSNAPGQFLRQSPSPSAPSPATMGGPSPASIGILNLRNISVRFYFAVINVSLNRCYGRSHAVSDVGG